MSGDDPKPGERQELTGAPLNTWASFQNEVGTLCLPMGLHHAARTLNRLTSWPTDRQPELVRRYTAHSKIHLSL